MEAFGKYQLVRKLGAGGMAEVFLARSPAAQGLTKLLVLKKIHPAFARSQHFVSMFVDEAKIALGLNHPNVVQVFDFGNVGDTFFLAMEYVEGPDLLKVLREGAAQQKRVPYGLCAYVAQQVAKGLDYAHRKTDEYGEPLGIVHRDVSPQNVLISWDGGVKITDFGIARARDVHEEEGVVKGKFAYMSPEQARGDPVDCRADIFSTGVVLFEMACARPLFPGKGREVLEQVKAGAVPRPRDVDPNVPEALEEIILKALAFRADDRYQTARDLQHALGRFQLHYSRQVDELFDSGTLAQFLAQTIERPRRQAPGKKRAPTPRPEAATPTPPPQPPPSRTRIVARKPTTRSGVPGATPAPSVPGVTGSGESKERKHIFVLEGRITGMASLTRHVGEERAKETVADFFRIAENIVYKHDALVHQERDATSEAPGLTYVIGLPRAREDDASRAIRLALQLVDALDGIGADVEPELRLSVGIQRGSAVMRKKGDDWEAEIPESTTAIARRLAREARGGEVVVGGRVFRVARSDWNFEELSTIDLPDDGIDTHPGASDTDGSSTHRRARIYRLRGPRERAQRMQDRGGAKSILGRELELQALRNAYHEVKVSRERRYILVIGDAGVGKRSLVDAFLRDIPPGEALVIRAAARAATSDTPYSIVADLARDFLGLAEGAEPKEVQRRLETAAAMLYPDEEERRQVMGVVEIMGMLLGVKPEKGHEIDPDERQSRISQAMRRIEERLSRERPLIMAVDDVHWADHQSWNLFLDLLRSRTKLPILGITTARPDERILDAASETNASTLVVEELGPAERERLILERFAPGEDATRLAKEVVAKAGGNPFFIRECIDSLVERGILSESATYPGKLKWVKKDQTLQVPASVEALVATRLDRLPEKEREVLTRAAVLGATFSTADVSALCGRDAEPELRQLALRGLVDRNPAPGAQRSFLFRNELTMQVAYDLLPEDERRSFHRAAARRLQAAPSYRSGQDDALIARHLERAGAGVEAARRYLDAARHALQVRGTTEAFQHLSRALALLPNDAHDERYTARAEREQILRGWARRPQQLREIHLMKREADALGEPGRVAQALTRLAQFYLDVGKAPAARRTLTEALDAARRSDDRLIEAEVLRVQASLMRNIGKNADALDLCTRALALVQGTEKRHFLERAQILNIRGTALWNMSRLSEAIEAYAEALVIYRKLKVPKQEARLLNNMGIVFAALSEYEQALSHYKRALKIDTDLGDRRGIGLKLGNIGQVYLDIGDLDRAEQYLTKALAVDEQVKDETSSTDATITLGQVYLKRGEAARARTLFERGLELATKSRSRYQEIRGLIYLAVSQLRAGAPADGALELARSATRLAREAPMPVGEIYGTAVEALALLELGRAPEAAEQAAAAVRLMDSTQDVEGAEEVLHVHARVARAAGRHAEAKKSLERALAILDQKAKRLKDPALRAMYENTPPAAEILRDAGRAKAAG